MHEARSNLAEESSLLREQSLLPCSGGGYAFAMRWGIFSRNLHIIFPKILLAGFLLLAFNTARAQHVITFGKPLPVKWFVGPSESRVLPLKVRALYVDGRVKEFTIGDVHDVTERLFVVRRGFRLNDLLPADEKKVPDWRWQRGGWILVDRSSGHISQLKLPDFDPFYSVVSWYRDYAAYCGLSEDGGKAYAVVAELGIKKPVVRKDLGAASQSDVPDSECPAPLWQRQPPRVTFTPRGGPKLSFTVRGHAAGLLSEEAAEPESK